MHRFLLKGESDEKIIPNEQANEQTVPPSSKDSHIIRSSSDDCNRGGGNEQDISDRGIHRVNENIGPNTRINGTLRC